MRLIFFGMPGRLAGPALEALLDGGATVAAVVVPAMPGAAPLTELPAHPGASPGLELPLAEPLPQPSLLQLAAARGLPVLAASRNGAAALAVLIEQQGIELGCVACWPWRLPPTLLAAPRHGFFNLHPSLLPDLRGPEPLFWAFREGRERSGVTIHAMDAGLDSGPIALQRGLELPVGISSGEAERRAAVIGAELLVTAVRDLAAGRLELRPQTAPGRFLPAPGPADFSIDPAWPARRAFGFMRGTAEWNQPYSIMLAGRRLLLAQAISYDAAAALGQPYALDGDTLRLQMTPGVLIAHSL